jgi:16S rRNA (adenine1518-N6/adenine1519-N6)-dimethyltransferase
VQNHTPRKRFGQNFLVDAGIIAGIINAINPQKNQHIIEIGPGQGALTSSLIASGAKIDAIELDRDLAAFLSSHFANKANFKLHSADILNFDLNTLYSQDSKRKLRLVGNLPYNISTPLLFKLFENIEIIEDMYFMLQKEVAERLAAKPNSKAYGRMSVTAQFYCDMQIVLDVPPASFDPAPKVDSSIVYFKPHAIQNIKVHNQRLLQRVTTEAFNQRRKTVANALKNLISSAELQQLEIDPSLRPENLTLSDYAKISNYLQTKTNS